MRFIVLLILVLTAASCGRNKNFDAAAATRWSQTAEVQKRSKAVSYSYQRQDGSWVCVSIMPMVETETGFVADGTGVLPAGFLVYPGAHPARTIAEAIEKASQIPGFQMER
ncbi:MAG: hypothetical protein ACO1TE_11855 [Prosthecobacter sp.]